MPRRPCANASEKEGVYKESIPGDRQLDLVLVPGRNGVIPRLDDTGNGGKAANRSYGICIRSGLSIIQLIGSPQGTSPARLQARDLKIRNLPLRST